MPAFDPSAFDTAFDELVASSGIFGLGLLSDPFDSLLNKTCDILENQGAVDSYGQRSNQVQDFVVIATVPCYVSTDAPGRPHEYVVEKQSAVDWTRVFMRIPALPGGAELSTHHWLLIDGLQYNIFNVLEPGLLRHHFEVICKVLTP